MKKYIYVLTIIVIGLLTSCDKFVDLDPKGQVIPREIKDLALLLNDYLMLTPTSRAPVLMEDNLIIKKAFQPKIVSNVLAMYPMNRIHDFEDLVYPADGFPDWDWSGNYQAIGQVNYVLNQLNNVTGSAKAKAEVEAEARVQRGYYYFMLVNQYARHYGAGDPKESETGLPIVTVFGNVQASLKRASIQEVYDFIILDLMFAIENHPLQTPDQAFKGSKWAANGLLANVYLHMANYPKALEYANAALNIKKDLMDYRTALATLKGNLGDPERNPDAKIEVIIHKSANAPAETAFIPGAGIVGAKQLYLTQDLLDLFDKANDLRYKKLTLLDAATGLRRYTGADGNLSKASYGFTTSELLMIRAESNARLNNSAAAMADVNYLRANRIDSTDPAIVNLTAGSTQEAIKLVLEEKRREGMFKGVRYFDIRRLNANENANISLVRQSFNDVTITLTPNDLRWVMPIGEKEIQLNPEIKQNPR